MSKHDDILSKITANDMAKAEKFIGEKTRDEVKTQPVLEDENNIQVNYKDIKSLIDENVAIRTRLAKQEHTIEDLLAKVESLTDTIQGLIENGIEEEFRRKTELDPKSKVVDLVSRVAWGKANGNTSTHGKIQSDTYKKLYREFCTKCKIKVNIWDSGVTGGLKPIDYIVSIGKIDDLYKVATNLFSEYI